MPPTRGLPYSAMGDGGKRGAETRRTRTTRTWGLLADYLSAPGIVHTVQMRVQCRGIEALRQACENISKSTPIRGVGFFVDAQAIITYTPE